MDLLSELQWDKRFFGQCPRCGEDFRLSRANLFSVRDEFPTVALAKIAERKATLRAERQELRERKRRMTEAAQVTAESVNLGKILEKIAPSFEDFGYPTRDCRVLWEPIDYVIFSGLSRRAVVDSITFLEVKSGDARLTAKQRDIANAVEQGRVEFQTV